MQTEVNFSLALSCDELLNVNYNHIFFFCLSISILFLFYFISGSQCCKINRQRVKKKNTSKNLSNLTDDYASLQQI